VKPRLPQALPADSSDTGSDEPHDSDGTQDTELAQGSDSGTHVDTSDSDSTAHPDTDSDTGTIDFGTGEDSVSEGPNLSGSSEETEDSTDAAWLGGGPNAAAAPGEVSVGLRLRRRTRCLRPGLLNSLCFHDMLVERFVLQGALLWLIWQLGWELVRMGQRQLVVLSPEAFF
jgi:hypothetical protein